MLSKSAKGYAVIKTKVTDEMATIITQLHQLVDRKNVQDLPQTFAGFVGNEKSAKIIPEFHLGNKPEAPKEGFQ